MDNKKVPRSSTIFTCSCCNYDTVRESQYIRHLNTAKHQMITNDNNFSSKKFSRLICINCSKEFKYRSGLSRHKQKCTRIIQQSVEKIPQNDINSDMVTTMMQLIKQNQEFKELIIELSKKDTTTNNTITNNNQKFNLNVFLNTTCKDAMNMSEFIENMEIQFEDIENIGRDGYVTGMTNMIMSRIKNLEVTKRPMHCTDLKRETIYIKDNNVWEKDNDNTKFHNMIQCIAHKNYAILPAWREKNPDCLISDTSKFDFCIKMMTNLLGDTGEGQKKLDNKVIRNIAKHINVDKNTIIVKS